MFTWRGKRRGVAKADGPERIHGEWWTCDDEMFLVREADGAERADRRA